MSEHDWIIQGIICVIVCIQLSIFLCTIVKTRKFGRIFSGVTFFIEENQIVPQSVLVRKEVLHTICTSLNRYLDKNREAVSDFHLMKDIVERNCDSQEEEIQSQLPLPLYLGLMGTMIGIIVGLVTMPGLSDHHFEDSISVLIGGVKIAMISSVLGLLLTTLSSGWLFKGAKIRLEKEKNDFYTFLQTDLLPDLSQNGLSMIRAFEGVIAGFSHGFRENSETFNRNFQGFNGSLKNMDQVASHFRELTEQMRQLNLVGLSRTNLDLLKKISVTGEQIGKLGEYLVGINEFVENSRVLNETLQVQLEKTAEVESIAKGIEEITAVQQGILQLIQADVLSYKERKEAFRISVTDADAAMKEGIEQLRDTVNGINKSLSEAVTGVDARFSGLFEHIGRTFGQGMERAMNPGHAKELEGIKGKLEELLKTIKEGQQEHAALLKQLQKDAPPPKRYLWWEKIYTFFTGKAWGEGSEEDFYPFIREDTDLYNEFASEIAPDELPEKSGMIEEVHISGSVGFTSLIDKESVPWERTQSVWYFATPDEYGSFAEANRYDAPQPKITTYRLEVLSDRPEEGWFWFDADEDSTRMSVNAPEREIEVVCEAENTLSEFRSRIRTCCPGQVTKREGKWIVEKKAVIQYE